MILKHTTIFIPQGKTDVWKVRVYTHHVCPSPGIWNTDTNQVVINDSDYAKLTDHTEPENQVQTYNYLQSLRKIRTDDIPFLFPED